MRHEPILLALLLFVPGLVAGLVWPSFPAGTVYFEFDKPNGSVSAFDKNETLTLTNYENQSVTTGLNVTVTGISGVTVTSVTSILVPKSDSEKVILTFHADSSMAKGEYSGTLVVSGDKIGTTGSTSHPITVEIEHPPATINATWNPASAGNVKAGSNFSYTLTVSEVMGYKSASGVNVSLFDLGPIENLSYNGTLGDFGPLTSKDINVKFNILERGLEPGTYSITPIIRSASVINANADELNYNIPSPVMKVTPLEIDFEKITFETGKDSKTVVVNISETGGYTPIEGLNIILVEGEEGWITPSDVDYIPAGNSESYGFGIFLPSDASLGLKNWNFKLYTPYTAEYVRASVIVSFPGTDEAISSLENISNVTESPQRRALIQDTISLLETSKDKTQLRKIAMVMSVYSGTRTFLSNIDIATNKEGRMVEAGDAIIRAKAALNKMEIGDQNLQDAELKLYSNKIVSQAREIWDSEARSTLSALEENAENEKDSNYKLTALYYNRISDIYVILDEPAKAEEYSLKQSDIEKLYHDSLLEASTLAGEAEEGLEFARVKTFSPGENTYIVLNPFSYDFVSGNYDASIDKYEKAEALYRRAGEESDADLLQDKLVEITRQKNNIFRIFLAYGSLLGLVFLWFVGRVFWGLQNYTRDEMDGHGGDVLTGEESKR
ncbi:hypothetical protein KKA03_01060 [archaeon]|nr:hypothetical protein [archaeon]